LSLRARALNLLRYVEPSPGWRSYLAAPAGPSAADVAIEAAMRDSAVSADHRAEALFDYFLAGFVAHRSPTGERVVYRGAGSTRGYAISGVEGFARTAPLLAAWLASGRPGTRDVGGRDVDLARLIADGLAAGSDPAAPSYWGRPSRRSQLLVEAADIALILWLGRETILPLLPTTAYRNLVEWLALCAAQEFWGNNWLLMQAQIEATLAALRGETITVLAAYERFKANYREGGWFSDGQGPVDYYNAWQMTYALHWIQEVQPTYDAAFIEDALVQSSELTLHLISPHGIPILGRSVCYRTAVPTPVVLRSLSSRDAKQLGRARRALDVVWRYFVAHGALRHGTLTQGYFGDDVRWLDSYSGPGSSHWGLRSLIPALLHPRRSAFWTVAEQPLPVEMGDYRLDLSKLGWVVEGRQADGEITITIEANSTRTPRTAAHSLMHKGLELLLSRPMRPINHAAKYDAPVYSALRPFPLLDENG
jgi:hypothetical protein